MRILLVEDNDMNRDMLTRRLSRRGYEVSCAADGAEAIQKTRGERPDLVLMDIGLPVVDGWQAIRTLKAGSDTARIPIIALTAHALAEDHARALAEGCHDFVSKPINLQVLLDAIQRHAPNGGSK
jgi:CheY-like chemotaxis protein